MFPLVLLGGLLGLALLLGQKKASAAQPPLSLPPGGEGTTQPEWARLRSEELRREEELRRQATQPTTTQVPTTYTVVSGDSPWTVAQKLTGDGMRWRELVAANPQKATVVQPDGSRTFKSLYAGEVLRLPESWRAVMAQTAIYMPEETITARRA